MVTSLDLDYRNIAATVLKQSVQEILGGEPMKEYFEAPASGGPSLLSSAARLQDDLELAYGAAGGKGLALRIGRAIFKNGLAALGEQAGFRAMEFRMLPSPRRIENGLQAMAAIANQMGQYEITVTSEGASWQLQSQRCPACLGRHSSEPSCYWVTGFLQEFASWAGGGRFYRVAETECRAIGAPACVFQIDKHPLD